jgi:hypothetical protein
MFKNKSKKTLPDTFSTNKLINKQPNNTQQTSTKIPKKDKKQEQQNNLLPQQRAHERTTAVTHKTLGLFRKYQKLITLLTD